MNEAHRKRRWFCYSLRTMLVVVLVLSVWLGYMANQAARQRRAVALVEQLGGHVVYKCEVGKTLIKGPFVTSSGVTTPSPPTTTVYGPLPEGPLYDLLGVDWFHDVVRVYFTSDKLTDEHLGEVVDGVPNVEVVGLGSKFITDASLERLAEFERLETLLFMGTSVTHEGVAKFRRQRPKVSIGCDPSR